MCNSVNIVCKVCRETMPMSQYEDHLIQHIHPQPPKQIKPEYICKKHEIKQETAMNESKIAKSFFLDQKINFGKYRGKQWKYVLQYDSKYLDWIMNTPNFSMPEIKDIIRLLRQ